MKIDYIIKGTKLPIIPEGTEYRVSSWKYDDKSSQLCITKNHFISFGWLPHKGYTYILCEKPEFEGKDYFMIKLSDIEKLTETKETMKTITYSDAQRIIDIACPKWKEELFGYWGRAIILKHSINITDDFYQEMRKACTSEQHKLFDDIFGEDTIVFPDGTPCLVRVSSTDAWSLRYANGKGRFYVSSRKDGEVMSWKQSMKLDMDNLPVNK